MHKIRHVWGKSATDDRGTTVVETALVFPVFLTLLFGMFQFAQVGYGYCNACFAARMAARYASLHSSASMVPATVASVQSMVAPYFYGTGASVASTTLNYPTTNTVGGVVTVTIGLSYPLRIPFRPQQTLALSITSQRTIMR